MISIIKNSTKIKYWRDRAIKAEGDLKNEAHINSFMVKWLQKVHPTVHKEMHEYYAAQSNAKLASLRLRLRGRMRHAG